MNGEVITRVVDDYTNQMVANDICSYAIISPSGMGETDQLKITVDKIKNAIVYVAKGKSYKWINHLDEIIENGEVTLDTRM